MRADSVAKLTEALTTPGTLRSAFSTLPTQEAQVMPPTEMSMAQVSGLIRVMSFFNEKDMLGLLF
jgi:hypothetical protein